MKNGTKKKIKTVLAFVCVASFLVTWYFAECYGQLVEGVTAWDVLLPMGICAISGFSAYLLGEGSK